MARNTKKKLAIVAGTSRCFIYAEAKCYASEMPGEIKYYECSRTEYCCSIGCCVSPGLNFHHLWYYWILVIIMFLVCSGGGWWYRYWLQGRYRAAASAIPTRATNTRGARSSMRGTTCQGQRARITYNSARNTVLLHRMWKGPQRNGAVPAYNGNATTSAQYQNMSVMLNDANCPYYQLYGPPPSYETVIAQTRGKVSSPASPGPTNARANVQSPNLPPAGPHVPQCFSYACNFPARLNNGLDQCAAQYTNGGASSRQLDVREGIPYPHFPQYCTLADGTLRRNVCVPFGYQEQSFVPRDGFSQMYQAGATNYVLYPLDKSSDTSDQENQGYQLSNAERYTMMSVDCAPGSSREQGIWKADDRAISKVHGSQGGGQVVEARTTGERIEKSRQNASEAIAAGFPCLFKIDEDRGADSKSSANSLEDFFSEFTKCRRVYGGSLRATGRYAGKERREQYSVQRGFSKILPHSCDGLINTEPAVACGDTSHVHGPASLEDRGNVSGSSSQSNPSNNVILECFGSGAASSSHSTGNVEELEQSRSRLVNASTNSDLESKHRLDRSKSLD
ncbi:uncharacterized protein LOC143427286 [Xylocopa sonorina]|uniref:uncharacterized protein LOC143427286 n=1 Tax=Xylocopa sonorina TaxID=1818115 RepID=UPI00403B002B